MDALQDNDTNPFLRVEFSWPNHLLTASTLNIATMAMKFQHEFAKDIQTIVCALSPSPFNIGKS